ncbi:YARHG domain-containing protein [Sphingobacterium wenxiniae]|uniref:YARHG domain-containing protein n=1 Tax=Sphingobacterium wenxiniae TaxID=683125 RepID=A0A1I6Q8D5_9SPHI|nr:YARHG domain-containing protein [Sphingobacterium wenxiniae]SFS48682.1 YARHG domain-containing protein [Sphingobacterium wenxiniae]
MTYYKYLKAITLIISILIHSPLFANDGAFFARGNQLIPINETEISVQKEILRITKIDNRYIEVSVYYEFFNPAEEKEIIVGFEAMSPSGDVDGAPINGQHPYMHDFTVRMNDLPLDYKVALISDSLYNHNGNIKTIDWEHFDGHKAGNYVDFFYVYHFNTKFKKGKNTINHTYRFDVSGGIAYNYYFEYVLTAANRWANRQIDDFTLEIDMGHFEEFYLNKSFFNNINDWKIQGKGKICEIAGSPDSPINTDAMHCYVQHGKIVFTKKKFRPKGELFLQSFSPYMGVSEIDGVDFYLPFSIYLQEQAFYGDNTTPEAKKILRNLPFARRGYVFQDPQLHHFYSDFGWYIPNPKYVAVVKDLTVEEQQWLERWK